MTRRAVRHDRHGRAGRSSVLRPPLRPLTDRIDQFDTIVASTADYLRDMWPDELAQARFEVAPMPMRQARTDGIDRWSVDRARHAITLYRLPIQRLSRLHVTDDAHRRMVVEACVFRATAEYLGRDPWDVAPGGGLHF